VLFIFSTRELTRLNSDRDPSPFKLWRSRGAPSVFEGVGELLELRDPAVGDRALSTSHPDNEADSVPRLKEASRVAELCLKIMGVGLWAELQNLRLNLLLLLLGLLLLIAEASVVHDPADRWSSPGSDFDEIEATLFGEATTFMGAHMTKLTTALVDDHYDGDAYLVINSPTFFQVSASLP
jgi:hypothetical protein